MGMGAVVLHILRPKARATALGRHDLAGRAWAWGLLFSISCAQKHARRLS